MRRNKRLIQLGLALIFIGIQLFANRDKLLQDAEIFFSEPAPVSSPPNLVSTAAPSLQSSASSSERSGQTALSTVAPIERIIDGDTIVVTVNNKSEVVRIIGINTPEVVDPRKSVECFGKEASDFARSFFAHYTEVELVPDDSQQNRDKYGRLLRYVFVHSGQDDEVKIDYGRTALESGFAQEYTYIGPYLNQLVYKAAQQSAINAQKGLWNPEACGN